MTLDLELTKNEAKKRIGPHQDFTLEVSFPETVTKDILRQGWSTWVGERIWGSIYRNLLYGSQYFMPEEFRFSGYDWVNTLEDQIAQVYGSLNPRPELEDRESIPGTRRDGRGTPEEFYNEFGWYIGNALSNGLRWGHKLDPTKKMWLDSSLGKNGILYTVTDEGNGFDVAKMKERIEDKEQRSIILGTGGFLFNMMTASCAYHNGPWQPNEPAQPVNLVFGYNNVGNQWMFLYEFTSNRYLPAADVPLLNGGR